MSLGTVNTRQGKIALDWFDRFRDPATGKTYIVACASHQRGLGELPGAGVGPWHMWPESEVNLGGLTLAQGRAGRRCKGCSLRLTALIERVHDEPAAHPTALRRIGEIWIRREQGFVGPDQTNIMVSPGRYPLNLDPATRETQATLPGQVISFGPGSHERVGSSTVYHWRASEEAVARTVGEHLNVNRYLILLEPGVKAAKTHLQGSDGQSHPVWRLSLPKVR
jgi:hypothetical protein